MFLSYVYNSLVCNVMGNYWMFMDRLKNLGFLKIFLITLEEIRWQEKHFNVLI